MEKQISDKIYYIGVNDRTSHRFEGLWPLPSGVSYNSYLAIGSDKVAIIDGVEVSHAPQQIAAIRHILADRQPDYLVINHMEPDHSGSIEILRTAFPDLTLVGNAQTLGMVKGFYGDCGETLAVKQGDSLPLGADATLRFFLTPMVHWPETMMTLFEEKETLFTGDAFGCFGALNGAVMDTDMDVEPYFHEMVRYYSNIVGKYGRFVQRALSLLSTVKFSTVCPTHGPVWHQHLNHAVGTYDTLSRNEPLDDGATVIYGSMYGNTARMAEAVAEGLAEAGVRTIAVHDVSSSHLSFILADIYRHRHIVLAAPTYSDGIFPPMQAVIEAMTCRGMAGRRVALIGTHTWSSRAPKAMAELLATTGVEIVGDPLAIKQAGTSADLQACRDLGRKLKGR